MSILNMASDGRFNVLIILVRALIRFGPKPREDLLESCGAKYEQIEGLSAGTSVTRWTELGLFALDGESVMIDEPYRGLLGNDPDLAEAKLPKILRGIVLAPHNNARFWQSEENKSADFSRALAWLLAQDVYSLDTSSHRPINELESAQIMDEGKRMFQNDTRWNGARVWGAYLGFARSGSKIVIDPTVALAESLDDIFASETLTARDFVERAAEVLPVLDGGAYRREIEEALRDSSWKKPPANHLSTSLSRAIKRLAYESRIALEQRSDTEDGVTLLGTGQREWGRITHVRRLQQSGEK
ncbi:protein DpdG [Donghicola tyrosinivorans]|uniref:Uncharacterized protein n=1 Tax=Donghicola tyrosinivorans TaxID=1652492 RepID=A0A2T0WAS9_9RHOB|nr:protein DpdG [Donghicola tyrosinivorans]PRY83808.1 hypothetical protein CLV74_1287 [Donghicola tyrosinivorans]